MPGNDLKDRSINDLVRTQNQVYVLRQSQYDNPTVRPGYDRLTEALIHLSKAIDLITGLA